MMRKSSWSQYYRPSQKASSVAMAIIPLMLFVFSGILGGILAHGLQFFPQYGSPYYHVVISALSGVLVLVGLLVLPAIIVQVARVRNTWIGALIGLNLLFLTFYSSWVTWFYLQGEIIYAPRELSKAIGAVSPSDSSAYLRDGGILLAALILTYIGWAYVRKSPFCEQCQSWFKKEKDIYLTSLREVIPEKSIFWGKDKGKIKKLIEEGKGRILTQVEPHPHRDLLQEFRGSSFRSGRYGSLEDEKWTEITIQTCPQCQKYVALEISLGSCSYSTGGGETDIPSGLKRFKRPILDNLLVRKKEVERILSDLDNGAQKN